MDTSNTACVTWGGRICEEGGTTHTALPCPCPEREVAWEVLRVLSCRTATVWKTLCPFWGEEYQVHLPPTFHAVAFYVLDEDALRWVCLALKLGWQVATVGLRGGRACACVCVQVSTVSSGCDGGTGLGHG